MFLKFLSFAPNVLPVTSILWPSTSIILGSLSTVINWASISAVGPLDDIALS